ncbi:MAG: hypothetical protein EU531_06880 [Promethearchaeota archaeon]|nr:MAG: hypothetical protein EU531_06880 [Candidatus Lokiarchaeota archaeon]
MFVRIIKKLKYNESNNHKLIFLIFSGIILSVFFIGGFITNLPLLLLISVYALLITNYTLLYNKKILNSLSIPLTFTYLFITIYDFSQINFLFAIFHLITVISCIFIFFRLNVSFLIMVLASIIYAIWIFSIITFLEFPYYQCVFGFCNPLQQFFLILLIGIVTSVVGSNNPTKRALLLFINEKLNLLISKVE